jgi:hypothetical protein
MKAAKAVYVGMILGLVIMAASNAHALVVTYTLDNVILDDNNAQMSGTFTWTYNIGDFENGVGQFTFLDIPFTLHDHTDLDAAFDIGSSIEITLEGSVHDDGVDITLFLLQPLTPLTSSSIDLVRSKYEIGGNGFHDGSFLSGQIVRSNPTGAGDELPDRWALHGNAPNPFNPATEIRYSVPDDGGELSLRIYDVRGRLIRSLVDGEGIPGERSVTWDGRDERGQAVASGVYFYRLTTAEFTQTRKMALLK